VIEGEKGGDPNGQGLNGHRYVVLPNPDKSAQPEPVLVSIDIHDKDRKKRI
jgi:hypothetical protein